MMCPHCKKHIKAKEIIQESKEDYWLCKCKDFHIGFPYQCPLKKVYLVGDCGPEHDSLHEIYKDKKKAFQAFQELRLTLLKSAKKGLQYSKDNAKECLKIEEKSEFWKKIAEEGDEMYLRMIKNLQEEDPIKIDNYPHETPYLREEEIK